MKVFSVTLKKDGNCVTEPGVVVPKEGGFGVLDGELIRVLGANPGDTINDVVILSNDSTLGASDYDFLLDVCSEEEALKRLGHASRPYALFIIFHDEEVEFHGESGGPVSAYKFDALEYLSAGKTVTMLLLQGWGSDERHNSVSVKLSGTEKSLAAIQGELQLLDI